MSDFLCFIYKYYNYDLVSENVKQKVVLNTFLVNHFLILTIFKQFKNHLKLSVNACVTITETSRIFELNVKV